jgi:hypothetical protein
MISPTPREVVALGHKRIEKTSLVHFGYASFFSIRFCAKILRHLAGLNFGFRAYGELIL